MVQTTDKEVRMDKSRRCVMSSVFVILLFQIGCMSDEANRCYFEGKFPPKKASEVQILREAPQKPYTVIADFQANNASFNHMQKRAAEVGADAVIVVPVGGNYSRDEVWASKDRFSDSYRRIIGTAIKYNAE
jgi:hypothetical protein